MEDVMFVIKCLIVTVVLVVCLQIRVGQHSVEGHMMSWIHHSPISQTLQDVAEGTVKVSKQVKRSVAGMIGSSSETPDEPKATEASQGSGWFKVKRSKEYYRQQKAKRAHASDEEVNAQPGYDDGEARD